MSENRRRGAQAVAKPAAPLPLPEPGKPLRIAYFRVSTKDQTIDAQRQELGGHFDEEFTDEGFSGAIPAAQRPGFAAMLARVRAGDTIFVAAVDRLGRNAIDVQQTVKTLIDAGVTVDVKGIGPINRGVGEIILAVLAQISQLERMRIIERTQAGRAAAKASLAATGKTHRGKDALGRSRSADPETVVAWRLKTNASIETTARQFDISDATVKRYCALVQGAGQKGKRRGG